MASTFTTPPPPPGHSRPRIPSRRVIARDDGEPDTEGLVDVLKFALRKRPSIGVSGIENETVVVSDGRMSDAVLIGNCTDAVVLIEAPKVSKVVIHDCVRTRVLIASTLISGCVEVISSSEVVVGTSMDDASAHTWTVDMCSEIVLHLPQGWGKTVDKAMIVSGLSSSLQIGLGIPLDTSGQFSPPASDSLYSVPDSMGESAEETHVQMATHRVQTSPSSWVLASERIVREGIGHVTTQARLEADNERDARNTRIMDDMLDSIVSNVSSSQASQSNAQAYPEPAPMGPPPPLAADSAEADPAAAPAAASTGPAVGGGLASAIASFNTDRLRPTETRVTTVGAIIGDGIGPNPNYGHGPGEDITEYEDAPEVLEAKVAELAEMVRKSRHMVAYTGAGISASAGIPTYRGPEGVWTLLAKGLHAKADVTLDQAVPTQGHMALAAMLESEQVPLAHIVSTNLDGLHRRSGVPKSCLSELHGSAYLEVCSECGTEYERVFDTTPRGSRSDHKTGRVCEQPGCEGDLLDSIVNFGENLPEDQYGSAYEHSTAGDLALVLGTSMRVSPACDLPRAVYGKKSGAMVIVNLQKTPYDDAAALRIFGKTDQVLCMLASHLGVEVADGFDQFKASVSASV